MSDSAPYKQSSEGLTAEMKRPAEIPVPLGEKPGPTRIALVGPGGYSVEFDSDGEDSDSRVEETTPRSASPESDGSGGGQDAGTSGKEPATPSASPVADGCGGGNGADSCESDEDVFGPMPLKEWRKYQKTKMRRYILQQSFPTTTSFSGASPSTSASLDPGNEEEVCSSSENTTGSSLFPVSDDSGGGEEAGALAQNEPDFLVKKEKRKAAVMTFTTRSMAKAARPWEERTQDNQCPLE